MEVKNKNNKIIPVATVTTFVLSEVFQKILNMNLDRYERCCFYMLLFLCITELIKNS